MGPRVDRLSSAGAQRMETSSKHRPASAAVSNKASARQPLRTVAKALDVLCLLNLKQEWLGVREIARMLKLNSATAHNLLRTLKGYGLVDQNPDTKKYQLGLGLVQLAGTKLRQLDLVTEASPFMKSAMEMTGETITLSVLDGQELLYLAKIEGSRPVRVASRIGGSAPLHCSANGKALLAYCSEHELDTILAKPLTKYNEKTVISPKFLREELRQVRSRGYAVDFGTYIAEVNAVAAPIRDQSGNVIASMGIIAPANCLPQKTLKQIAGIAVEVTNRISRSLGWNAATPH